MPVQVGQLHRLVHRGVHRHAVEEQDLIGAQPQHVANPRLELAEPDVDARVEHPVDAAPPAQRALHQLVEQRLVTRIAPARVGAVEQPIAECAARVDGVQHLERRLSGVLGQYGLALGILG